MDRTSFTLWLVYSTRFHQVLHYSSTGCIFRDRRYFTRPYKLPAIRLYRRKIYERIISRRLFIMFRDDHFTRHFIRSEKPRIRNTNEHFYINFFNKLSLKKISQSILFDENSWQQSSSSCKKFSVGERFDYRDLSSWSPRFLMQSTRSENMVVGRSSRGYRDKWENDWSRRHVRLCSPRDDWLDGDTGYNTGGPRGVSSERFNI